MRQAYVRRVVPYVAWCAALRRASRHRIEASRHRVVVHRGTDTFTALVNDAQRTVHELAFAPFAAPAVARSSSVAPCPRVTRRERSPRVLYDAGTPSVAWCFFIPT